MNKTHKALGAATIATVAISFAPNANALSLSAWSGAANPRTNADCFTESYGAVTNSACNEQETWEIALPVDSAGMWSIDANVTIATGSISCQGYAVDPTGTLTGTTFGTLTSSGDINLTEVVGPGGSMYVACFVPEGATVNTVNWAACGGAGQPACGGNVCSAPALVDLNGTCSVQVLTSTASIAAEGNGAVVANVTLTAVSSGTLAMTFDVTNSNQLTGFDYVLECNVGDHAIAYAGNVPNAGINLLGGSQVEVNPGTVGMVSPAVTADWANIQNLWQPPIGSNSNFQCALTADSTLDQTLDELWTAIAGAYLQDQGIEISTGDACLIDCTGGTPSCPAKCTNQESTQCTSDEECDL